MLRLVTCLLLIGAAPLPAWSPETIPWQRINPDGTRFALLEGVRDRPGAAFTYAFFIPAGVWDGPHSHAATARVFVAKGVLRLGQGDRLERDKAVAYPAGSVLVVPAGVHHFDGASEDTIIIGTAVGPWSTDYVKAGTQKSAGTPE